MVKRTVAVKWVNTQAIAAAEYTVNPMQHLIAHISIEPNEFQVKAAML